MKRLHPTTIEDDFEYQIATKVMDSKVLALESMSKTSLTMCPSSKRLPTYHISPGGQDKKVEPPEQIPEHASPDTFDLLMRVAN